MTHFEEKFIVINLKDYNKLGEAAQTSLHAVLARIVELRKEEGRDPDPNYYTCNRDEPYAKEVLRIILEGEQVKINGDEARCDLCKIQKICVVAGIIGNMFREHPLCSTAGLSEDFIYSRFGRTCEHYTKYGDY